jgi:hypothetical protein
MDFYGSGLGDRLIDESLFPLEIKEFLRGEDRLLEQCISSFDSLIEVGCMRGRYLQWAIDRGLNYFGIDIVSSYIETGHKRLGEVHTGLLKCDFILGGAEDIDVLLDWKILGIDPQKALLFFPFNSFGNMQDFLPVIRSIRRSGARFFISTYSTIPNATLCRQRYYDACLYLGLEKVEDNRGVTFISRDGLHTIAYHLDFLIKSFKKERMIVDATNFADIGIIYTSPNVFIVNC